LVPAGVQLLQFRGIVYVVSENHILRTLFFDFTDPSYFTVGLYPGLFIHDNLADSGVIEFKIGEYGYPSKFPSKQTLKLSTRIRLVKNICFVKDSHGIAEIFMEFFYLSDFEYVDELVELAKSGDHARDDLDYNEAE
jgi:hypothetical protein